MSEQRLPFEHPQNGDNIHSSLFSDEESATNDPREAPATDQSLGRGTDDEGYTTITNVSAEGIQRRSTFEVEPDASSASLNSATNGSASGDTSRDYGIISPDGDREDISTLTDPPPPPFPTIDIPPEPQPNPETNRPGQNRFHLILNQIGFLLQEFRVIPFIVTVGVIVAGLTVVLTRFVFKPDPPPPVEPTKEAALCSSPESCRYKFEKTLDQIERELYLFRDEIVRVHALSCDESMFNCSKNNYNECDSVYPDMQCVCGNVILKDQICNARRETSSHTAVRIPVLLYDADEMENQVVESVCITRLAEPYMIDTHFTGNQIYFGSKVGSFRIIPAAYSECYTEPYDPRHRSWYISAASGKKDVILLIDNSESMEIESARQVVKTILKSLTLKDRVAIVAFSDKAWLLGDETRLVSATSENKDKLERAIDNLAADGNSTNFYDAFETAFNAWDNTTSDGDNLIEDKYEGCNLAVLFLTDGQNSYKDITSATLEEENEQVMALINEKTEQIEKEWNIATAIFTFSFGDKADKNMSKTFACSTGGFWQHVEEGDDLINALSSYYEWYALGLVEDGNEDLAVWVPEYTFASSGKNGTTVSVPVYDRSVSPPIFLGVAAMDVYMEVLYRILGDETKVTELLQIHISEAKCPSFSMLNEIDLDILRSRIGGEEATCGDSNSTQFNGTGTCDEGSLPEELFGETISDVELMSDIERICCECQ